MGDQHVGSNKKGATWGVQLHKEWGCGAGIVTIGKHPDTSGGRKERQTRKSGCNTMSERLEKQHRLGNVIHTRFCNVHLAGVICVCPEL
eukprot:1143892-Pelagomonas_calceolata.AAC.12